MKLRRTKMVPIFGPPCIVRNCGEERNARREHGKRSFAVTLLVIRAGAASVAMLLADTRKKCTLRHVKPVLCRSFPQAPSAIVDLKYACRLPAIIRASD